MFSPTDVFVCVSGLLLTGAPTNVFSNFDTTGIQQVVQPTCDAALVNAINNVATSVSTALAS